MVNMERKHYTGLFILICILIVLFGVKMASRIELTNVNESGEEVVERVYLNDSNETIFEDVTKKDKKTNEAVVSIKNSKKEKIKKINSKVYKTKDTKVKLKKKIIDETYYK